MHIRAAGRHTSKHMRWQDNQADTSSLSMLHGCDRSVLSFSVSLWVGSCSLSPPFQMCASQYHPSNLFPHPPVNFCLLSVLFESLQIQTLKPSCSDFAWPRSSEVTCCSVSSPVLEPVNEVLQLLGFFFCKESVSPTVRTLWSTVVPEIDSQKTP